MEEEVVAETAVIVGGEEAGRDYWKKGMKHYNLSSLVEAKDLQWPYECDMRKNGKRTERVIDTHPLLPPRLPSTFNFKSASDSTPSTFGHFSSLYLHLRLRQRQLGLAFLRCLLLFWAKSSDANKTRWGNDKVQDQTVYSIVDHANE
ncbi:hypothetical protein LguiA_009099 [Lonicera macranthoides]